MTGLLTLVRRLRRALGRAVHRLVTLAGAGVARVRHTVVSATRRHIHRWQADRSYRRTLTAALAAVGGTLLPHPVATAAMGAWLAETPTTSYPGPVYRADPDDDEDDSPTGWGSPLGAPTPRTSWSAGSPRRWSPQD